MQTVSANQWSPYQLAIFREVAEGRGHTVVLARAGSGKTSTIMESLRHVPAGCSVLLCAFNKAIAEELQSRAPSSVTVQTLHAYGLRTISKAFGRVDVDAHKVDGIVREIYPENTQANFARRRNLARAVSFAKGQLVHTYEEIDAMIDSCDLEIGEDTPTLRRDFVGDVARILTMCRELTENALGKVSIDFDDMVWLPVVLGLKGRLYDRVFVDETQDLNPAQIRLALRACHERGRICAVGDDRQAIYGFRGADRNAVVNVIDHLRAKVMPLSVSYRCARSIVELAKTIVLDLEWAPNAPDGEVVHASFERMKQEAAPGDFILSRANAPLVPLCLEFLRQGRRANIQGRDIGATLANFVRRHHEKGVTVEEFREYVSAWRTKEIERLSSKVPPRSTQAVEDKSATLLALTDDVQSLAQTLARIEALFSDTADGAKIVLSTTHKAKGLERERVFVLDYTYRCYPDGGIEEENLAYVAYTRAKSVLFLVSAPSKSGAWKPIAPNPPCGHGHALAEEPAAERCPDCAELEAGDPALRG